LNLDGNSDILKPMRRFCITGSIDPKDYYFIPSRLPSDLLDSCIEGKFYFGIHAPRQSGKSTAAKKYVRYLTQRGKFKALYCSLDVARATGNGSALVSQCYCLPSVL
jgi:hypothetical protein